MRFCANSVYTNGCSLRNFGYEWCACLESFYELVVGACFWSTLLTEASAFDFPLKTPPNGFDWTAWVIGRLYSFFRLRGLASCTCAWFGSHPSSWFTKRKLAAMSVSPLNTSKASLTDSMEKPNADNVSSFVSFSFLTSAIDAYSLTTVTISLGSDLLLTSGIGQETYSMISRA